MANEQIKGMQEVFASASMQDRFCFLLLMLMNAVIPVMGLLSHRGFAPMILIAGIGCAANKDAWRQVFDFAFKPERLSAQLRDLRLAAFIFLLFCLWLFVASFWSPLSGRETIVLNVLTPVLSAVSVIAAIHRLPLPMIRWLAAGFAISAGLTIVLLAFEWATGGLLREMIPPVDDSYLRHKDMIALGRGTTALVVMAFPALAIARMFGARFWQLVVAVTVLMVSAAGFGIFSNALGLTFGLVTGLALLAHKGAGRLVFIGVLAAIVIMPIAAMMIDAQALNDGLGSQLPISWQQRAHIWSTIIGESSFWGQGVDYARWLSRQDALIEIEGAGMPLPLVPTHPHNVVLQILVETGVPGFVLFLSSLGLGGLALLRSSLSPSAAAAAWAVIAAGLISFLLEASLWQVWRVSVLAIATVGIAFVQRLSSELIIR